MATFESKFNIGDKVFYCRREFTVKSVLFDCDGAYCSLVGDGECVCNVLDSDLEPAPKELFIAQISGGCEYTSVFNSVEALHFWCGDRYNNGTYKIMKLIDIEE
ncbi:hypothetical protein CL622_04430 [archaeon]|nr:hypothetical protein [archaeon]|tara:strand:- start:1631 stop:1942 length:312 start_codon:yes stop_codon:yes gene_type:complete